MSTHQLSDDGRNVDELVISRSRGFQYGDKTVTFRTPIIPVVLRILGYQSGRTSNFIPSPPSNSQGIYDLCILKGPTYVRDWDVTVWMKRAWWWSVDLTSTPIFVLTFFYSHKARNNYLRQGGCLYVHTHVYIFRPRQRRIFLHSLQTLHSLRLKKTLLLHSH